MENIENSIERIPKDISKEFLTMGSDEFQLLLRELRNEPALSITIDFTNIHDLRRLKAINDSQGKQEIFITVRATREQAYEDINAFESGIKWIEV